MLVHDFVRAARWRSRSRVAAIVTALALVAGAGPAAGTAVRPAADPATDPAAYNPNAVKVGWVKVVGGLSKPVLVTHAGDGSGRLFIVEQTGRIRVFKGNTLLAAPFLNLSASISTGSEQGLLGLAFHPSFETNGKFYVNLTLKDGKTAINEYRAALPNPATRDTVDWRTGRRIMTIAQPYSNHNGGHLAFGPDGYLYIGTGDGGSAGDPGNRAQSLTNVLGKMLRIDINGTAGTKQYRIPSTNPYAGPIAGYDEIWSRGLRNPWRWSFDRSNGDLYIADVGQNRYEEVNISLAPDAGRAANYGWRMMEGRHCYNPSTGCTSGKVLPVVEYAHAVAGEDNCSVTGGYVYRGTAYPALQGGYLFGDYCSGRLWSMAARSTWPPTIVEHQNSALHISSFGEDEAGNVYIVFIEGVVYKITGTPK